MVYQLPEDLVTTTILLTSCKWRLLPVWSQLNTRKYLKKSQQVVEFFLQMLLIPVCWSQKICPVSFVPSITCLDSMHYPSFFIWYLLWLAKAFLQSSLPLFPTQGMLPYSTTLSICSSCQNPWKHLAFGLDISFPEWPNNEILPDSQAKFMTPRKNQYYLWATVKDEWAPCQPLHGKGQQQNIFTWQTHSHSFHYFPFLSESRQTDNTF